MHLYVYIHVYTNVDHFVICVSFVLYVDDLVFFFLKGVASDGSNVSRCISIYTHLAYFVCCTYTCVVVAHIANVSRCICIYTTDLTYFFCCTYTCVVVAHIANFSSCICIYTTDLAYFICCTHTCVGVAHMAHAWLM